MPFIILGIPTCTMCIIAESYIKAIDDNYKFITINELYENHFSQEDKEKFVELLVKRPLAVPIVLRFNKNKWSVFDISPFIQTTLTRVQKEMALIKK